MELDRMTQWALDQLNQAVEEEKLAEKRYFRGRGEDHEARRDAWLSAMIKTSIKARYMAQVMNEKVAA